jgi:hypothetical protein
MARPIKGLILNEGYTNLETIEVNISNIEQPTLAKPPVSEVVQAPPSTDLLFRLQFGSGDPVPPAYKAVFKVGAIDTETYEYELYPNASGYLKLTTPLLPMARVKGPAELQPLLAEMVVDGPLNSRAEECYLRLTDDSLGIMYTLIRDLCVHDGYLCVYGGGNNYFRVATPKTISSEYYALYITPAGNLYGYHENDRTWDNLDYQLTFWRIQFPGELESGGTLPDGFYKTTSGAGDVVSAHLGSGIFSDHTASLLNKQVYNVTITADVFRPGSMTPVFSGSFDNVLPGANLNYTIIDVPDPEPEEDTSPTLAQIEDVWGESFSATFMAFLASQDLNRLDEIRQAGPITEIEGFPATGVGTQELKVLQGHVDLYRINPDSSESTVLDQNQILIEAGYSDIYTISNTPREQFLANERVQELPLFRAAQIYDVATQNQKFASNLIRGVMTDLGMKNGAPPISGSKFSEKLTDSVKPCGCSDCQSAVSPFAYLMDLLRYGAGHIDGPSYTRGSTPAKVGAFITLLETKFFQLFGSWVINCESLHDTFCRVRLVTEVLEKRFENQFPAGKASLTVARKRFFQLVYDTLLTQMGTSTKEVQTVFLTNPNDKIAAAESLANRLGLPSRVPGTDLLTTNSLWLTIDNQDDDHDLTAASLEIIFGFRDTLRDRTTPTPVSLIEEWQDAYLRQTWKAQDYAFTAYSREDVDQSIAISFKSSWKPIIDADIMGWQDLTPANVYYPYAVAIWQNRKADTDSFLHYCVNDHTILSRVSADMALRTIRVTDRNIVNHAIDQNLISIENPPGTWVDYEVASRQLIAANTDVVLSKTLSGSPVTMLMPSGNTPKMRYRRSVEVESISGTTSVTLSWTDAIISDWLSGGYARLESTAGSSPYETSPPGVSPLLISAVSFNNNQKQVTLTLSAPGIDTAFLSGSIHFVYESEVPLYTHEIPDPEKLCQELFDHRQAYVFLESPGATGDPSVFPTMDDSLRASWSFDGNSTDDTGTHNGTDTLISYSSTEAVIGEAAVFGSGSYISFSSPVTIGVNDFTLSVWIRPDGSSHASQGTFYNQGGNGTGLYYLGGSSGSPGKMSWYEASSGGDHLNDTVLEDEVYSHIVVRRTGGVLTIWKDGQPDSSSFSGTGSFTINRCGDSFSGALDICGIWGRALSAAEIGVLYNSGSGRQYPFPAIREYNVWTGLGWTDAYDKLKLIYNRVLKGQETSSDLSVIETNMHLSVAKFNRMMSLLAGNADYLASMYKAKQPSSDELYEAASIARISAKDSLKALWVKEEIMHTDGSNPIDLCLSGQYFWKSLTEPADGVWDPRLQTIPKKAEQINSTHVPIIDPELLDLSQILDTIQAAPYRSLWETRRAALVSVYENYYGLTQATAFDPDAFTKILNEINTGNTGTPYDIYPPYADLQDLLNDLNGPDVIKQKQAADVSWDAFRIGADDMRSFAIVKAAYELDDPLLAPSEADVEKTLHMLVTAYKCKRLYADPLGGGWIEEEITGSFSGGTGYVYYYDVVAMNWPAARANRNDRSEWQRTLASWNKYPIIQPDIVPPENILEFKSGEPVYDTWNARRGLLITAFNTLGSYINTTGNASNLLSRIRAQLDLIVARLSTFTPLVPATNYLPYYDRIAEKEKAGEDIRPYLTQLGISIAEYRYLSNVITQLTAAGTSAIPLMEQEYKDIKDILIAIRSRNLTFAQVVEDYEEDIILASEYFQIYTPAPVNFPSNELPVYNEWRSPVQVRKQWADTLEGRNDRSKAVDEKWKDVLQETEDRTMPVMRDALIAALATPCEVDPAERLARSFFIETKDNCCVKHTRVSFAMETLQGLIFALENGVYDNYVSGFTLVAPQFRDEWPWIGSYATWRSAVFISTYPENLLYPTLKRLQSPEFSRLAHVVQGANSLSPEGACAVAGEYQNYLNDVENMQLICTTTARQNQLIRGADGCCDTNAYQQKIMTFYFGQGSSGKPYWSYKDSNDNSDEAMSFWEALPIDTTDKKDLKLTGCFALGERDGVVWGPVKLSLFLFYSFRKDGKLMMAYITRDLLELRSRWGEEQETEDLPKHEGFDPIAVTACQQRIDWGWPSFVFTCASGTPITITDKNGQKTITPVKCYHHSYFYSSKTFNQDNTDSCYVNASGKLISSVRLLLHPSMASACLMAFEDEIRIGYLGEGYIKKYLKKKIIGMYDCHEQANCVIIVYKTSNTLGVSKLNINLGGTNGTTINVTETVLSTSNVSVFFKETKKIYPIFGEKDVNFGFAIDYSNSNQLLGVKIDFKPTPGTIDLLNAFTLKPPSVPGVIVQSAECISNMKARKMDIMTKAKEVYFPGLIYPFPIRHPKVVMEMIWEAYYFMPMMLALDQQRRGQFVSALDWYRTVYDYTQANTADRKIFYGLVIEQSFKNVLDGSIDWLSDPLNPHKIGKTRKNAYTKYTVMNIIQCLYGYADQQFTIDTIETVPIARKLYTEALDLLKTEDLQMLDNECADAAQNCLDREIELPVDPQWDRQYRQLKDKLAGIGNAADIEFAAGQIALILDEADEESYAESFADAFLLVANATPSEPPAETISARLAGIAKRSNDSYRYVSAFNDLSEFNTQAGEKFALSIASISDLPVDMLNDAGSVDRLSWLNTAPPPNDQGLSFAFADPGGQQFLSRSAAFDPTHYSQTAYQANLNYVNATYVLGEQQNGVSPDLVPIATYDFCLPENPVYDSLMLKGNLELYKIFNCRNIAGIVRELDVFSAPTDSTTGIPVIGANGSLQLPGVNNFAPSQYRFKTLLERAKQIVAQAQQMESLFLSALEKKDNENYALLQATQGLETARAKIKLQDLRITQAKNEKGVADLQLSKVVFTKSHFDNLIASGYNSYENESLALLRTSADYLGGAIIAQQIAGVAYGAAGVAFAAAALNITDPSRMAALGHGLQAAGSLANSTASGLSTYASKVSTLASVASQLASYARREEEWNFQSQLAGYDIGIANQQIKVAEDGVRIATQERAISELDNSHAREIVDFMRNKFTNAELYNFMSNELEKSYNYLLNLGTAIARTAERQLYFERQEQAGPFILSDYWEAPSSGVISGNDQAPDRRGLTGSARLLVDITRLEQYAFESYKRKLQLTKVISLAQNFPSEFQAFKESGVMNFELSNRLFDYDFPGHYLRLINSVKTTVVGLLPVYDQIKATLTAGTISYTVIGGTTFQRAPIRRMELDAIALSTGASSNGLFELQPMQNELLNPFEGMGLESRWEFNMPKFSNRFDFEDIADVLITVEYTALDSYQYRYQVLQDIGSNYSFNRGFSFRNHFPDQWFELGEAQGGSGSFGVEIDLKRDMFPMGIENLRLDGNDLLLYFVREDGFTNEITVKDFNAVYNTGEIGGNTLEGKFYLSGTSINTNPVMTLRLRFDDTFTNRELFSNGHVKDILLLVGCKADLRNYPL